MNEVAYRLRLCLRLLLRPLRAAGWGGVNGGEGCGGLPRTKDIYGERSGQYERGGISDNI